MKEKLQEYALIAEIVGGIAVVISLIYVAISVQENTAAIQSASAQSVTNASTELLLTIAENENLADLRMRGRADFESLEPLERSRYGLLLRQQWVHLQNIYVQYTLGVLEEAVWHTYNTIICDEMAVIKDRWPGQKAVLSQSFVEVVEKCPEFMESN